MKTKRIIKEKSISLYKQFFYSFLLVLILPVIVFSICFFNYNQKIYEDKIMEHMEQSMNVSVQALEGHLNNLDMTMRYHAVMYYMQDRVVAKDIFGFDITDALAGEVATNTFVDGICYYNEAISRRIYTETGTYTKNYYTNTYLKLDETSFLEKLNSLGNKGWISVQKENDDGTIEINRVYYVVKGEGENDWWLFKLSKKSLNQILQEYDIQVILLDSDGNLIYKISTAEDDESKNDIFTIRRVSEENAFIIEKNISKNQVLEEVTTWRLVFAIVIILILVIGSAIVIGLTNYHIQPIIELRKYCEGRELVIPETVSGFGIFLFTIKSMDMQIEMMNDKKKKDRLLLEMLWDADCGSQEFYEKLKKNNIFQETNQYCVIVAVFKEKDTAVLLNGYQELALLNGCELHIIDTLAENRNIIIVGSDDKYDLDFETELENMVENVNSNDNHCLQMFVGELGRGIEHIRLSYKQALLCSKDHDNENVGGIVYYKPITVVKSEQDDENLIEKVCDFINDNISLYDLNVSFVADYFGISISNISHQFKRQVGKNILDYITEKKFNYAAKLLCETDSSVLMIATMLGYSQSASFIRKFKSIYGVTPANYRNKNRDTKNEF